MSAQQNARQHVKMLSVGRCHMTANANALTGTPPRTTETWGRSRVETLTCEHLERTMLAS